MYELHINKDGQTQPWFRNFFSQKKSGIVWDMEKELKEWNAEIFLNEHQVGDRVVFKKEQDLSWFLLHWS
jgi:hypothetical protein